jgi:hypothetical protein
VNEKTLLLGALLAVGIFGLAAYFIFDRFMWWRVNIFRILENEIRKQGGTLLSVEKTGLLDTGPFANFDVKPATADNPAVISTAVPLGNKTFHKKVHWRDEDGGDRISWARIDFVTFYRLRKIEWRDDD